MSDSAVEVIVMPVSNDRLLTEVELRCPEGPKKLFAKLKVSGQNPVINSDNLIELACQDCRRRLNNTDANVHLVLHRYNIIGDLVETVVIDRQT